MEEQPLIAADSHLIRLLDAWKLRTPRRLRPVDAGTNNLSRVVETPDGSYFLRIYQNLGAAERADYEHRLLKLLGAAGLPFQVPVPIATRRGDTLVAGDRLADRRFAALFQAIPGRHPVRGDLAEADLAGAALATLHRALKTIDLPAPSHHATYGEIDRIHPLVPDPLGALAALPVPSASRRRILDYVRNLIADIPSLYATLPRQVIHADFARSNLLVDNGQVTGILDFEFAGPDLRAIDLAAGLWSFSGSARGTGQEWPIIKAFLQGYLSVGRLAPEEVDALPTLVRLREATSLIHWLGRWRHGLTDEDDVNERVEDLLDVDQWASAADWRALSAESGEARRC